MPPRERPDRDAREIRTCPDDEAGNTLKMYHPLKMGSKKARKVCKGLERRGLDPGKTPAEKTLEKKCDAKWPLTTSQTDGKEKKRCNLVADVRGGLNYLPGRGVAKEKNRENRAVVGRVSRPAREALISIYQTRRVKGESAHQRGVSFSQAGEVRLRSKNRRNTSH